MTFQKHLIQKVYFPLMEVVKGNRIRTYKKEMEQLQRLSVPELYEHRKQKLGKLLEHCIHHVPIYQHYAALQSLIAEDPVKALQQIAILTKADFNERSEQHLAQTADQATLIANRTGGSTGVPVTFYMDRYTVEHYEAARWRGLGWHGIEIGDPSVMVWGNPLELSQQASKKFAWKERMLKNRIVIPAFDLRADDLPEYIAKIEQFKPRYLYGYASALYMLAKLLKESELRISHELVGIVSTAETLLPAHRNLIEGVFQCQVINEYGARDGGILAYECTKGQMHLQAENVWLEVVDLKTKAPLPPGQEGLIVVTDLNNRVMPRLRYEIGDYGSLSNQSCDCGLSLPLLNNIQGRAEEVLVTKQGAFVHGQFFAHIIRNLESIAQYQIIQHSVERITIKLVPKGVRPAEHDEQKLMKLAADKMEGTEIALEYVEQIPLSASGKVRNCIREFSLS